MHNMIIESEWYVNMVFNEPFDYQDPLADKRLQIREACNESII